MTVCGHKNYGICSPKMKQAQSLLDPNEARRQPNCKKEKNIIKKMPDQGPSPNITKMILNSQKLI